MGLLIKLSVICTCLLSVASRGLLAPKKKGAAQVKNVTAKNVTGKLGHEEAQDEVEYAPPLEPFEEVDNDVDEDADQKEMKIEEDELHEHHEGRMFGLHKVGEKDTVNKRQQVDPMDKVHTHRTGADEPKVRKAAVPAPAKKAQDSGPTKVNHLDVLKDLVGADDEEAPKPAAKPEQKPVEAAKPANNTVDPAVSEETAAEVAKMKAWREKEKAAEHAPKKVNVTHTEVPKKPHNLGKDLAKVDVKDMAPLDDKVVAKLKEAMPTSQRPVAHVPSVHEHEHGDAIGRLHAHAATQKKLENQATAAVHTTTTTTPPAKRTATPAQLAAARRASSLTDALRDVNASEVEKNLDISASDAIKIRNMEAKVMSEAAQMHQAEEQKHVAADHMEELRETAEKALDAKVRHLAEKKEAKQAAAKKEPASKLAAALGIDDEEAQAMLTTTAAPKSVNPDPIKALHQRIEATEPKKPVEKPKAVPTTTAVPQKNIEEEPESGVIAGFHHNKARDALPPVLR